MNARSRTARLGAATAVAVIVLAVAPARATNDTLWNLQWNVRKVALDAAWTSSSGAGVKIAIIDTGVDLQHQDLASKIDPGWDFVAEDNRADDVNGHGTFVAGIAAAVANNGAGIAGAAPGARIVPLRIAGANGQSVGDAIARAMAWAVDEAHAQVINLSFGSDVACFDEQTCIPAGPLALVPELDDAIYYAFANGALVVAAAGNSRAQMCAAPGFSPFALCVGGSNEADALWDRSSGNPNAGSNRGIRVDLVAPSVNITSTYWSPSAPGTHNAYGTGAGTSFAAPLVAGAAALLMAEGATNVEAMHYLRCSAKDLGATGPDLVYGWGRLDAARALQAYLDGLC